MRRYLVLLLAAAACGDDGSHQLPDAPLPPDAAIDAAPDTPVTITITAGGAPRPGVEVYFLNPDDSLVAKTTTDANGVASAVVLPGASVTAIDAFPERPQGTVVPRRQLRTFVGVKPGDDLQLSERWDRDWVGVQANLPLTAAADTYVVDATCGDPYYGFSTGSAFEPSFQIYLYDCDTTADFVVQVFSNGEPIGWFYRENVEVTDGGTLDFVDATYQTVPEVMFTFDNVPANIGVLDVNSFLWNARGALWELDYYEAEISNGTGTLAVGRPNVPGTRAITRVYPWGGNASTRHQVMFWGAPATTTHDLAGALLHEFTEAPSYDPATRTLRWGASATGTAPDFSATRIFVEREVNKTWEDYEWQILAPYSGPSRVLPKLPDEAFPFLADAESYVDVWDVTTAKVPGGYDAVRERVFAIDQVEGLTTGASGRVSIARYDPRVNFARTRAGKAQLQRAAAEKATERARRAANRR